MNHVLDALQLAEPLLPESYEGSSDSAPALLGDFCFAEMFAVDA